MPIRPIDKSAIIPKLQEVAADKQSKLARGENLVESTQIQGQKEVEEAQKKVVDTKKTEHNIISDDDSNKSHEGYGKDNKKKEKKQNDSENETASKSKLGLNKKGQKIYIRI